MWLYEGGSSEAGSDRMFPLSFFCFMRMILTRLLATTGRIHNGLRAAVRQQRKRLRRGHHRRHLHLWRNRHRAAGLPRSGGSLMIHDLRVCHQKLRALPTLSIKTAGLRVWAACNSSNGQDFVLVRQVFNTFSVGVSHVRTADTRGLLVHTGAEKQEVRRLSSFKKGKTV